MGVMGNFVSVLGYVQVIFRFIIVLFLHFLLLFLHNFCVIFAVFVWKGPTIGPKEPTPCYTLQYELDKMFPVVQNQYIEY